MADGTRFRTDTLSQLCGQPRLWHTHTHARTHARGTDVTRMQYASYSCLQYQYYA